MIGARRREDATPRDKRSEAGTTLECVRREWLFQGADEWFRGIYVRAGCDAPETLAICSSVSGEGKTTIGLGLAATLALDFPRRRVVVVETNLHRPVLADDFGFAVGPGLIDWLAGGLRVEDVCRSTALPNLDLVPAGDLARYEGRPLRSSRMAVLIETLRQSYATILLDTPALLANSDAQILTDLVDGVIFVVRGGITPVSLVSKALEQIDETKRRGVVLNAATSSIPGWLRRLTGSDADC